MMLILVVASLFSYQILGGSSPIVGGQFSEIFDNPWLVSIQKNGYHMCVGSIISERVILTAAHCVINCSADSLIVRVGSSRTDSGGKWHRIVAIRKHEKYGTMKGTHAFRLNDVALMKVQVPFEFRNNVASIQLARNESRVTPGTAAMVAGWESVTPNSPPIMELKSAELQVVASAACARNYGDKTGTMMSSNHLICASKRGRDACLGDSGGPLIAGGIQIGVVSGGIGCATSRFPGVYTDVAHHRNWININAQILESSEYYGETLVYHDPISNHTFYIPTIV